MQVSQPGLRVRMSDYFSMQVPSHFNSDLVEVYLLVLHRNSLITYNSTNLTHTLLKVFFKNKIIYFSWHTEKSSLNLRKDLAYNTLRTSECKSHSVFFLYFVLGFDLYLQETTTSFYFQRALQSWARHSGILEEL